MKREILNRLRLLQKRIRLMILMVEKNKSPEVILPKIDRAQKELVDIRNLILKCSICKVSEGVGLTKNKQRNLLKLCGF